MTMWRGKFDKLFIGGQWISPDSGNAIDVVSPFTEQVIASTPSASKADVDRAVAAARDAFDNGPWPRMSLAERIEVMKRLSATLSENRDVMASLISSEMGCPITLATSMQATGPRLLLDSFIDMAQQYPFQTIRRSNTGNGLILREPVGVVAAVIPWNAPMLVTMIKMAPALLAGCTFVLKPAPETPLDAYLMAEMLQAAGLPDGVFNVVPADREISEYLVMHPGVDKVSFTGSTGAGRRIASLCGEQVRRVTLELGGKSAAIILDDADIGQAVESLKVGSLRNSGQVCSNKTRIVVSHKRRPELLERLAATVAAMQVGDPSDPMTQIGPMVSARQRERVEGYITSGRSQGAKVVVGGGRPALVRGWFVEPTIFSDVDPNMTIAQEEIFGPVIAVLAYDTEEEAVAIANNSQYGLNGSVFTGDPAHGVEVAKKIHTGTVEINGNSVGFHSPIGGFKKSGIGREAGLEGFDAYVELKSIGLPAALADAMTQ